MTAMRLRKIRDPNNYNVRRPRVSDVVATTTEPVAEPRESPPWLSALTRGPSALTRGPFEPPTPSAPVPPPAPTRVARLILKDKIEVGTFIGVRFVLYMTPPYNLIPFALALCGCDTRTPDLMSTLIVPCDRDGVRVDGDTLTTQPTLDVVKVLADIGYTMHDKNGVVPRVFPSED